LLRTLFATGARTWSAGPQVNWPILQGGSIAFQRELQKALRDQAYINYQKTVLAALQGVETPLWRTRMNGIITSVLTEAYIQNRKP